MTPLRQRMLEEMHIRNLSLQTQRSYLGRISLFARYFGKSSDLLGPDEVRTYQLYLATIPANSARLLRNALTTCSSAMPALS